MNERCEIEGMSNEEWSVSDEVQIEVVVLIRVPFLYDVVMFSLDSPASALGVSDPSSDL